MKFNKDLPFVLEKSLSVDNVAIFLFHGVIKKQKDPVRNYTGKHIEVDLFNSCMKSLKSKGYPLSMDEILFMCLNNLPFPPNSFAITFDDGFENNLSVAAPLLSDLKIPLTIYITTNFVNKNEMSWIDRIEYIVQEAQSRKLNFDWSTKEFSINNKESRIEFLNEVRSYVKNTSSCNPNQFADELSSIFNIPEKINSDDQLDLKMSWKDIILANQNEYISFGGHSHTHPILSFLNSEELNYELDTSLNMLLDKAGILPKHYSYPEGLEYCFSEEVIKQLKIRGVKCCPTAIKGVNKRNSDPFRLKRIMVNSQ